MNWGFIRRAMSLDPKEGTFLDVLKFWLLLAVIAVVAGSIWSVISIR